MINEDTLIIHDTLFKQVCFVCKRDNSLKILSKDNLLGNFIENIVSKPVYKTIGGSDGDICWDGLEQITIDDKSYMINLYEAIRRDLFSYISTTIFFVSFLENVKRKYIDTIIKNVWTSFIPNDYKNKFLLYEDSLKNSLYYHLRTEFAELMECSNIRIYPEYQTYRKDEIRARIDLAIVEFREFCTENHLGDSEIEILSAIEIKYVGYRKADDDAILSDVKKCLSYLSKLSGSPHIYITFIQEAIYNCNSYNLLGKKKIKSKERLTELLGYIPIKNKESEEMEFHIVEY